MKGQTMAPRHEVNDDGKPRCIECGTNLLTHNAWIHTPAGDLCLNCEAARARHDRIAKVLDRSHLGKRWPETFDANGDARPAETDGNCDACNEPIGAGQAKELGGGRLCPACFIPAAKSYLAKRGGNDKTR